MKKYGKADMMRYLLEKFMQTSCTALSEEQKRKILERCDEDIRRNYLSARDLEVAG